MKFLVLDFTADKNTITSKKASQQIGFKYGLCRCCNPPQMVNPQIQWTYCTVYKTFRINKSQAHVPIKILTFNTSQYFSLEIDFNHQHGINYITGVFGHSAHIPPFMAVGFHRTWRFRHLWNLADGGGGGGGLSGATVSKAWKVGS